MRGSERFHLLRPLAKVREITMQTQTKRLIGCRIALLLVIGVGLMILLFGALLMDGDFAMPGIGRSVAIVEIFGVIGDDDGILEQLDKIEQDASVEALVMHVNSPGGGAAATQRIVLRWFMPL